jgi:hypothetical protein
MADLGPPLAGTAVIAARDETTIAEIVTVLFTLGDEYRSIGIGEQLGQALGQRLDPVHDAFAGDPGIG